jgi:proteasome assembly chaperone (PAC2) family protein
MSEAVEIWERPKANEVYMLAGWRQWADAGSISSGLPQYLIQLNEARKIGEINSDGFYIFQIPGTHDLVRPVVKFDQGYPESLEARTNELYYAGDEQRGLVIFAGVEPHLDIERYVETLLSAAEQLRVKRIIGFGGVYGELPYDKERLVSGIYSLPKMKEEMEALAVNLSDYQGGASIGSYICKRAGERGFEYAAFYAFVPNLNFSRGSAGGNSIRIENDYTSWLGVLRRVNHMLGLDLDLSDLEKKSKKLLKVVEEKIDEIDNQSPQLGVRDYLRQLSEDFTEVSFDPLDDVWEDEIRRLLDKFDGDET